MKAREFLLAIALITTGNFAHAQGYGFFLIEGSTSVPVGSQSVYTASFFQAGGSPGSNPTPVEDISWYLPGNNNKISESDFSLTVQWNEPGTHTLEYNYQTFDNFFWDSHDVTVEAPLLNGVTAAAATNVSSSFFTANWTALQYASSYQLDVSAESDFSTFVTGFNNKTINGLYVQVSGLIPGETYHYRVRGWNPTSTSPNSNVINVQTTIDAPPAPTANSATSIVSTEFAAHWTVVAAAESYELDISTTASFESPIVYQVVGANQNYKSITGLTPSTLYYYRVRSKNSAGTSGNSNVIEVQTAAIPLAPTALSADAVSSYAFNARWSLVGNATYRVDVATESNFGSESLMPGFNNLFVGEGQSNIQVSGLLGSSTYYYRIRAVTNLGTSLNSNAIAVTTLPAPPPPPVAQPATQVTASSFVANWSSVPNATSYRIDISTDLSFTTCVSTYCDKVVSGVNVSVAGLSLKERYYYRVRALNAEGPSINSNIILAVNLTENYVRAISPLIAGISERASLDTLSYSNSITTTHYSDGLGRLKQTVFKQLTPNLHDFVQPVSYDRFDRQQTFYLPYASASEDGWIKRDFVTKESPNYKTTEQFQFYQHGAEVAKDSVPYQQITYEVSPRNRIVKEGGPGAVWQPDANVSINSSDKTTKYSFESNGTNEVMLIKVTSLPSDEILSYAVQFYLPNELSKTQSKDENGALSIVFVDKYGKTILKQVQISDSVWAETYFVYDIYDNLVTVIPPEAVKLLKKDNR